MRAPRSQRRDPGPQIGQHLATLNLFLEADGRLYVTCAGADVRAVVLAAEDRGIVEGTPADKATALVRLADNIVTKGD